MGRLGLVTGLAAMRGKWSGKEIERFSIPASIAKMISDQVNGNGDFGKSRKEATEVAKCLLLVREPWEQRQLQRLRNQRVRRSHRQGLARCYPASDAQQDLAEPRAATPVPPAE